MRKIVRIMVVLSALLLASMGAAEPIDDYWSIANIEGVGNSAPAISLSQNSVGMIRAENAKDEVQPILEFRCDQGGDASISLRINWNRFISSFNTEAGFRVDGGKTTWLKLGVDQSNKITFSRSAADAEKLLGKLGQAKVLEIEIAPYSESSVFAKFDISTLDAALGKLKEACQ